MAKINLKYGKGKLPENLGSILAAADEQDLRILVALLMSADDEGTVNDDTPMAQALGLEKSDIAASLKFWRGAGVISSPSAKASKRSVAENDRGSDEKSNTVRGNIPTAHRGGAVAKSNGVSTYATEELAELFERRKISAQFIDEAQRVVGKTFNSYDTGIVAGLVDQFGFEEEAVLAILAYVTSHGKKSLRYSEKLALGFYDEGLTTAAQVVERINLIERSNDTIQKIKQLFGIGSRELSRTEKTLFETWTQKFGYDIEVIRKAYDITVDTIHKPVPKYTSVILEKWYAEGLKTADDVCAYEQAQKKERNGEDKSYDLDDFFEAALNRSLEDLGD